MVPHKSTGVPGGPSTRWHRLTGAEGCIKQATTKVVQEAITRENLVTKVGGEYDRGRFVVQWGGSKVV